MMMMIEEDNGRHKKDKEKQFINAGKQKNEEESLENMHEEKMEIKEGKMIKIKDNNAILYVEKKKKTERQTKIKLKKIE